MKLELRRRMHANNMDFHYELLIVPTKKESRAIDGFLDANGTPQVAEFPFQIVGEICTTDNFDTYIRLVLVDKKNLILRNAVSNRTNKT
jgi:hypothetical protein